MESLGVGFAQVSSCSSILSSFAMYLSDVQMKTTVFYPKIARKDLCPVVILHSMLENQKTWSKIAPEIANATGRMVYTPDFRNHGESTYTKEYSIEILSKDLEFFLKAHELKSVILIGHSIGGKTAILYTLKWPKTVEKLILEDASAASVSMKGVQPLKLGFGALKDYENLVPPGLDKAEMIQLVISVAKELNSILRMPVEGIENYDFDLLPIDWSQKKFKLQLNLEAILDALSEDKLQMNLSGSFHGDTLLLYGKSSQFMGETGAIEIDKYFPRIKKFAFENTGHFVHHHHPEGFTQQVTNFINRSSELNSKL